MLKLCFYYRLRALCYASAPGCASAPDSTSTGCASTSGGAFTNGCASTIAVPLLLAMSPLLALPPLAAPLPAAPVGCALPTLVLPVIQPVAAAGAVGAAEVALLQRPAVANHAGLPPNAAPVEVAVDVVDAVPAKVGADAVLFLLMPT